MADLKPCMKQSGRNGDETDQANVLTALLDCIVQSLQLIEHCWIMNAAHPCIFVGVGHIKVYSFIQCLKLA
jgi:hypothetical protein